MAEYNLQYMNLRRKLQLIKVKLSLSNNTDADNKPLLSLIDSLGKQLDARYDEEKSLDGLEIEINKIAI